MDVQINYLEKRITISEDIEIGVLEIAGKMDMPAFDRLSEGFGEALKKKP